MLFQMADFRRFHDSGTSNIAPITILLGENSSGKTSFLAGLRYTLETLSSKGEGSFNREPFFLGAYDQIAHYRGGRFGRATNFVFKVRIDHHELERLAKTQQLVIPNSAEYSFITARFLFSNSQSQPLLDRVELSNKFVDLEMTREDLPQFNIRRPGERRFYTTKPSEGILFQTAGSLVDRNSIAPFYNALQSFSFLARREAARSKSSEHPDHLRGIAIERAALGPYLYSDDAVYASAPFRTKPERTYSPVEASSSAEGAHIPILLAQAKAFEPKKWNEIKERLEAFGHRSDMFKKIDVKRLGRHQSDPFQITVTVSKDRSNLIDVGYGVSQILPLLVETLMNERALFFLFQQPEVHLHPKAQAELGSYLTDFALHSNRYVVLETHSDFIIDRVKSDMIKRKVSLDDNLSVLFFERNEFETKISRIMFDEAGNVVESPGGYRNFFLNEAERTLGLL